MKDGGSSIEKGKRTQQEKITMEQSCLILVKQNRRQ
jgi:hypothetical protein